MDFDTLLNYFGGDARGIDARIAKALGVSRVAVSKWRKNGVVPDSGVGKLVSSGIANITPPNPKSDPDK